MTLKGVGSHQPDAETFRLLVDHSVAERLSSENVWQNSQRFERVEFASASDLAEYLSCQAFDILIIDESFPASDIESWRHAGPEPSLLRVPAHWTGPDILRQLNVIIGENKQSPDQLENLCAFQCTYRNAELLAVPRFFAAERLARAGNLSEQDLLKLTLMFQEVVSNALEHGNLELDSDWREQFVNEVTCLFSEKKKERLLDPHYASRRVFIQTRLVNRDTLELRVTNDGPGFNYEEVVDKLTIERSLEGRTAVHGRGLHLIYAVADRVLWEDDGRTIVVQKFLTVT
jgi:anti-sigma regulatory factor (Ser/Thr protein kinase)